MASTDAEIIQLISGEDWKKKAKRMRSGFFRPTSTNLRAIVKYIGVTLPQLLIIQREAHIDYTEDKVLLEKDYYNLVEVMENIGGLVQKLRPPSPVEGAAAPRESSLDSAPAASERDDQTGDGKRKRPEEQGREQGSSPPRELDILQRTPLPAWRRIADELPEFLRRQRFRVTPKDLSRRFNLDPAQLDVVMDECRFRCPPDRFLMDRDLRAVEDVLRDMPAFMTSLRSRAWPAPDCTRKRARLEEASSNTNNGESSKAEEPSKSEDRVTGGLLALSPAEWAAVQERFAAIAAKRKGTPKDIAEACSLSAAEVGALMSEARFSCGHAAMITLNNLARLHDLIESKAKDRSAEKALEKAQTESASRDMETLRLRPADGWARVLGRLKDFFVEGKTTPVLIQKTAGVSPVQMEAILRQSAQPTDDSRVMDSAAFERAVALIQTLSVPVVAEKDTNVVGAPDAGAGQSPVENGDRRKDPPTRALKPAPTPVHTDIPTAQVVAPANAPPTPQGPKKFRKITAEEFQATGGDPEVLDDVFGEYVDDSLEAMDEDVREHLYTSGFLVVEYPDDPTSVTSNGHTAMAVVPEQNSEQSAEQEPPRSGSRRPVNGAREGSGAATNGRTVKLTGAIRCSMCGSDEHVLLDCKFAVKRKRGFELDFNRIKTLRKQEVLDLRTSCREFGRLSMRLTGKEVSVIEKFFDTCLSSAP